MGKKKILIIGGGCSGHMAAFLLDERFKPYLLEANSRWGGHVDTQTFEPDNIFVDAGAAFINRKYCPNLYKLLDHYGISTHSFTLLTHYYKQSQNIDIIFPPVYINDNNHLKVEWGSLFSLENIKIMLQMQIVLKNAKSIIKKKNTQITIEEFLDSINNGLLSPISHSFKEDVFYPLIANAYFVDQEYYDICEYTDDDSIKKNIFYVTPGKQHLTYWVLNPDGELVNDKIAYADIGLSPEKYELQEIINRKTEIFEHTSKKNHTFKPDPNKNIRKFSAYAALNYLFQGADVKCGEWEELDEGLANYLEVMRDNSAHTHFVLEQPVIALKNIGTEIKPRYQAILEDGNPFTENGEIITFDAIVLATNGLQAGQLLSTLPSHEEKGQKLKDLRYYKTRVDVFSKTSPLPPKIRTVNSDGDKRQILFFEPRTIAPENPIFRTTNCEIDKEDISLYQTSYLHPFLDPEFYEISAFIRQTNGEGNIWIAGAIADGGDSQENAINAGLRAATEITERFKVPKAGLFDLFVLPDYEEMAADRPLTI